MASDSWPAASSQRLTVSSAVYEKQAVPLSQKCLMGQPVLALTSNLKPQTSNVRLFLHGISSVPAAFPLENDEGDEGDDKGDDAGHLG